MLSSAASAHSNTHTYLRLPACERAPGEDKEAAKFFRTPQQRIPKRASARVAAANQMRAASGAIHFPFAADHGYAGGVHTFAAACGARKRTSQLGQSVVREPVFAATGLRNKVNECGLSSILDPLTHRSAAASCWWPTTSTWPWICQSLLAVFTRFFSS